METKKTKYILYCPSCKSKFDVSEQLNIWKESLIEKIDKLVKKEMEK